HQFLHLQPPAAFQTRYWDVQTRKLVAEHVMNSGAIANIRLLPRNTVHINLPIEQPDSVAGYTDHALHKVLRRIYRVAKDNDIPASHRTIRHNMVPHCAAVTQLVDQEVLDNQQSLLSRFR